MTCNTTSNSWISSLLGDMFNNIDFDSTKNTLFGVELEGLDMNPQFINQSELVLLRQQMGSDVYPEFILKVQQCSPIASIVNDSVRKFYKINMFDSLEQQLYSETVTRSSTQQTNNVTYAATILGEILIPRDFYNDLFKYYPNIKTFLNIHSFDTRQTAWEQFVYDYFRLLFINQCKADCSNTHSINKLLMFDNIHDFNKPRKSYKPAQFGVLCNRDTENCLVNFLLREIMGVNSTLYSSMKVIYGRNYFGSGWEAHLLDFLANDEYISYIETTTFNSFTDNILREFQEDKSEILWSHDTLSELERPMVDYFRERDIYLKTILLTSAFDGYPGSFPDCSQSEEQGFDVNVRNIYDSTQTINYNNGESHNLIQRNFPNKFGVGGVNSRSCISEGGYTDAFHRGCPIRADVVSDLCSRSSDKVQDHLSLVAEEAIWNIRETKKSSRGRIRIDELFNKSNTGFFLTLKAMGDYMQLVEAKEKGVVFVTQDSMQFLIGAKIGVKIIKAHPRGIYYSNFGIESDENIDEELERGLESERKKLFLMYIHQLEDELRVEKRGRT